MIFNVQETFLSIKDQKKNKREKEKKEEKKNYRQNNYVVQQCGQIT